jgi:hypothetical protein
MDANEFLAAFRVNQDDQAGQTDDKDKAATQDEQGKATEDQAGSQGAGADKAADDQTQSDQNQEKSQDNKQDQDFKADKSANAFAQMRVQNKQYETMMKSIAGLLGVQNVNLEDPNAINAALERKILEATSKQQNVPVEVLERLQTLEKDKQEFSQYQIRQATYLGFQKIKNDFGLDNNALNQFADVLKADGVNPFEEPVDIVAEYKLRNFDRLVAEAETRGAQKEAERAAKANDHSTTPGDKKGQSAGDAGKINTVNDLEKFFNENAK